MWIALSQARRMDDDVIKWKHFARCWPFVTQRPMTQSFDVSLNGWVNNREAGDLRRCRAHYDVFVMDKPLPLKNCALNGFVYMFQCCFIVIGQSRDGFNEDEASVKNISHEAIDIIYMTFHDDVIKWKKIPRYWPFVRGIHRSPVNSPHKGQRRGALMFSLICVWINGWVNNREAGDLRRYHAHYDVTAMTISLRSLSNCCSH